MTTLFLDRECTVTLTKREGKGGDENLLQTILTEQPRGLLLGSSASLPFLFVPNRSDDLSMSGLNPYISTSNNNQSTPCQRPKQQNTNEEVVERGGEAIIVTSIRCFRSSQLAHLPARSSKEGNGNHSVSRSGDSSSSGGGLCLRSEFFSLASSLFVDKGSPTTGDSNHILLPPLPNAITTVGLDSVRALMGTTSASVSSAVCVEDSNNVMSSWRKALIYRTMSIIRDEDNNEDRDWDEASSNSNSNKKRKEKGKGSKHTTVLVGELYIPSALLIARKTVDDDDTVGAINIGRTASSPFSLPSSSAVVAINTLILEGGDEGGGIFVDAPQTTSSSRNVSAAEALVYSISALASNNLVQQRDTHRANKSSKVALAALIPDLIGLPLLIDDRSASAAGIEESEASSSSSTSARRVTEIVQFVHCFYYYANGNNTHRIGTPTGNNLLETMKNMYFGHLMSSVVDSGELDRVCTRTRILHVSQQQPPPKGNGSSGAKNSKGNNSAQNKGKTPSDNTSTSHPLCVGYVSSKVRLSFSASPPSKSTAATHRSSLSLPSPLVTSTNNAPPAQVSISGEIAKRLRRKEIRAVKSFIRCVFVESVIAAEASAAHKMRDRLDAKFKGASSCFGLLVYGPAGCGQQEIVAAALEELCTKRETVANAPSANESGTHELKTATTFSLCPFPLSFRGVEVSSSIDDERKSKIMTIGDHDDSENLLLSSSRLISPMLASVVDDPSAAWEFFSRFPLTTSKAAGFTCTAQPSPSPSSTSRCGSHALLVPIVIDNAEEVFPHDDDLITQVNLQRLKQLHGFLSSLNAFNNEYDNKKNSNTNMNNVNDARGGCGGSNCSVGSNLSATYAVPFVVSFTGKSGSGGKGRINRIALATLYSDGILSLDCSSSSAAGRVDAEEEGVEELFMSTSPAGLIEITLPSVSEKGEILKMALEQRLFSFFKNTCKKEIARFSFEQSSSSLGLDRGSLLTRTLASALCRTARIEDDTVSSIPFFVKLIDRIIEDIATSRARYAVGATNTDVIRIGMEEAERLWNSTKLSNAGVEIEAEKAVGEDCDNEDFVATARSLFISLTRAYEHATGSSVASHEYLKKTSDSEHEEPSSSARLNLLSFLQAILSPRGKRHVDANDGSSSYGDHEGAVEEMTAVVLPMSSPAGPRTTTWDDIGGLEDVKKRMRDALIRPRLVPESYARLGVTPPKGILLYGPPGCAKTTLVKALCSEGLYSFIYVDCASVLSSYVGESEQYLRDVFAKARSQSPCIVFFDEVDAVSGKRDGGGGGESDTAKLLSTLLIEMDGFSSGGGGGSLSSVMAAEVCFVGATNLPHRVDSALLRPGRFDLLVHVPLPDASERYGILRALLLKNYNHQFTANSGSTGTGTGGGGDGHRAAYAYRRAIAFASFKSFLTSTTVVCSEADEFSSNEAQVTPSTNKIQRGPSEALKSLFFLGERGASLDAVQPQPKTTDEAQPSTTQQKFGNSSSLTQYSLNNVIDIRFILGEILPKSYDELCALAVALNAAGEQRGEDHGEGLDGNSDGSFSENSSFSSEEEEKETDKEGNKGEDVAGSAATQSGEHEKAGRCATGRHLLRPLRRPAQTAAKSILTIVQTLLEGHSGADITAIIKEACTSAQRRFVESEKAQKIISPPPQKGSNGTGRSRSPTPAATLLVLTLADLQDAVLRSNPTVYDAVAIDAFASSH